MTIPASGDKIAPVANDGSKSRALTDRRRGGGTTGRQGDEFPGADEKSRKMMKKLDKGRAM